MIARIANRPPIQASRFRPLRHAPFPPRDDRTAADEGVLPQQRGLGWCGRSGFRLRHTGKKPRWCYPQRYPRAKFDRSISAKYWSGRQDSNLRPSAPKADALPDCATPRRLRRNTTSTPLPATGGSKMTSRQGDRCDRAGNPLPGRARRRSFVCLVDTGREAGNRRPGTFGRGGGAGT